MPKVSIVVPVYNVEKYLDRCVTSLANQTLQDIEIILVDDQSPDNSPEMCNEWVAKDSRIKVIHKTKNQGLGLARNSGLEIASGQYVTFVDSDDYLELNALEQLYNTAVVKDLDICYGSFCYDRFDGSKHPKLEVKKETFFIGRREVDQFLLDMVGPVPSFPKEVKFSVSVCKAIFKLDVFRKNNLLFGSEKEIASEDFLFHLNFINKVDRIGILPFCYYHYCENGESITHTYSDAKFNRIVLSMFEVKRLLSLLFPSERFMIHYQRCLFLSLRGVLSHDFERNDIGIREKLSVFKERCSNNAYSNMFDNYPYYKLNKVKMLLYIGMKYKLSILIYTILYVKKRLNK